MHEQARDATKPAHGQTRLEHAKHVVNPFPDERLILDGVRAKNKFAILVHYFVEDTKRYACEQLAS